MDPVSITTLCFTVLKNAGTIIFEFKALKDKIGGAVDSLEQLVRYVALLQSAITELVTLIDLGKLSATEESIEAIKDSLQICDRQLLLIAKYISKIKPRPRRAGLGFRGTFWSLWNEDAIKASKDVLNEQISSVKFLLEIIKLKPPTQQDQEIRNATQRGQIVVGARRSEATQRLQDFVASLGAESQETVQVTTMRARLAAQSETANSEIDNAMKVRHDSRLDADRARQRERQAVEAKHRRIIAERQRARNLGLPEEPPESRRWELLFRNDGAQTMPESSQITPVRSRGASRPRSDVPSPAPHATPSHLMLACAAGNVDQATALLDAGQDVNEGRGNMTALHIAAATGHTELALLLLANGANVEARDAFGQTALHVAAFSAADEIVALLIQDGADVESVKTGEHKPNPLALRSPDGDEIPVGWKPIHCAADQGHEKVTNILIRAGAATMARTYNGRTALHLASAKGHIELVLLLLNSGADPDARTYNNVTPLRMAQSAGFADIVATLTAAGAEG